MKLLRRPEPGSRSKHLDMRYFKIKELVDKGEVRLVHEGTDTMVADILTKPLGPETFRQHMMRLGYCRATAALARCCGSARLGAHLPRSPPAGAGADAAPPSRGAGLAPRSRPAAGRPLAARQAPPGAARL
jgi:hypothetical protein